MGVRCWIGIHQWNGCQCTQCKRVRNTEHSWNSTGCICVICGKTNHDWVITDQERTWTECVDSPGWECNDCYNEIGKHCSGGIRRGGRTEYRCRKCGEVKVELPVQQQSITKQCYQGDAREATESFPCKGCKYWDVINPSGDNTGWCYKDDMMRKDE